MDNALVSVIMPAYNAETYIEMAINSILNQTYSDFELIVVDDASMDSTYSKILGIDDSRVHKYRNDRNLGIAGATNRALTHAKGKYVCFLDDDDIAVSNRLELQVKYLENNPNVDVLGGNCDDINAIGELIRVEGDARSNPKYVTAMLLFGMQPFSNGTIMVRRDFLDKNNISIRDNMLGLQDLQFMMECSKKGTVSSIPYILYSHRNHDLNETKRQMIGNADKRHMVFSTLICNSLILSGFELSDEDKNSIFELFWESNRHIYSKKQIQKKIRMLKRIIDQAKKNEVDYYTELRHVCKKVISQNILGLDELWS